MKNKYQNTHTLTLQNHFDFLNQERKDPITGDLIKEKDEIVICASCKSAFLKESWEYLGNEHCGQDKTLAAIPIDKSLVFKVYNQNNFTIKEIPPAALTILILGASFFSILALLIFQEHSIKYLFSGIIAISTLFYSLFAIFPLNKIHIEESELIVTRGLNIKSAIPYQDIIDIIFLMERSPEFVMYAHVYIRRKDAPSISEELNLKNIKFNSNDTFMKFVSQLSKKTKVILKMDTSYQSGINPKNTPAIIEWI
ncbi:hypothetical protein ACE193_22115 [Bernardetia sp. OM2101]|uniref:hypothetical protein n=1 Tax=Bernardetia sp. OM2101 TaxID=3344876 RepID=UPI0035D0D963